MEYILYSTEVKLQHMSVMVPPMSMYHMRRLLELKDQGIKFDDPTAEDLKKIVGLLHEVIKENHPDLDYDTLEREMDARSLQEVMVAIQNLPKNLTAQTGSQVVQDLSVKSGS